MSLSHSSRELRRTEPHARPNEGRLTSPVLTALAHSAGSQRRPTVPANGPVSVPLSFFEGAPTNGATRPAKRGPPHIAGPQRRPTVPANGPAHSADQRLTAPANSAGQRPGSQRWPTAHNAGPQRWLRRTEPHARPNKGRLTAPVHSAGQQRRPTARLTAPAHSAGQRPGPQPQGHSHSAGPQRWTMAQPTGPSKKTCRLHTDSAFNTPSQFGPVQEKQSDPCKATRSMSICYSLTWTIDR